MTGRFAHGRPVAFLTMLGLNMIARAVAELRCDVRAAHARDPAAHGVSTFEILASWPGVQALIVHRVSHGLQRRGVPLLPRTLAYVARSVTGIEIHPAAQIGRGLFIDHGSGVVVGETAVIGDDVTIYQGVTLGGTGFQAGKRHPTVGDRVTIGSGAKLLGPITVGNEAKIGANSVVINDVPANTTVVGNPGHPVRVEGRKVEGPDVDWIHLPDPIADAMSALGRRVVELEAQVRALGGSAPEEGHPGDGGGSGAEVHELRPKQGRSPAGG